LILKTDARTLASLRGRDAVHVPEGFAVVTPYIFVDGADEYVLFLEAAFGACEIGRSTVPNGRIANCQVRFDTATIMLSEAAEQFPASSAAFYLYVADADASIKKAEKAGAKKIMDAADMPYGDRQGGVCDPSGNIWWLSQRKSAEAYF
jgi:PhnB protein